MVLSADQIADLLKASLDRAEALAGSESEAAHGRALGYLERSVMDAVGHLRRLHLHHKAKPAGGAS